ncbi:MAG: hypothetical protein HYY24_14185 [Verrucomicrobia bacterium]|nr:hypothetical protein [Verrucomicrobiota bacterium]
MRWRELVLITAVLCTSALDGWAAKARIYKVLPHRLDQRGRHALSPSLYERDAYQAYLHTHPEECSALRFDIQWRANGVTPDNVRLRVELRTAKTDPGKPLVLETPVKPRLARSRWSAVTLEGDRYKTAGGIIAWRTTLWEGERLLAEQKSFLW